MQIPACGPVLKAQSETLIRNGDLAFTALNARGPSEVFRRLRRPASWLGLLRPVASAYETWRGGLMLADKYRARVKAWPVKTALRPGIALNPELGLERWEAELALRGLVAEESTYVILATHLLEAAKGFTLELPGGVTAIVVRAEDFSEAVEIGEPIHLCGPAVLN